MKNAAWAVLALAGIGLLMTWLGPPKVYERRQAVWKESLAEAERARAKGDNYHALGAYAHAAQVASSIDDWRGLLTVACGLQRLGRVEGPSVYGFNVVMSAMAAAERQKSPEGMRAVAGAFMGLGASFASFALSRVQGDWPETGAARATCADCWKSGAAEIRPAGC